MKITMLVGKIKHIIGMYITNTSWTSVHFLIVHKVQVPLTKSYTKWTTQKENSILFVSVFTTSNEDYRKIVTIFYTTPTPRD